MAAMLADCSPAYVNNCARTMKALMNHAVKRQIIATSPLTEKIRFEEVPLPELELNDEERLAFLGAFDDESGFKQDVAKRRREAHVIESEHSHSPRRFGFGPNPDSDATRQRSSAFTVSSRSSSSPSTRVDLWSEVSRPPATASSFEGHDRLGCRSSQRAWRACAMPASRPERFFRVATSEVRIVRGTGANQAGDVRGAEVFASSFAPWIHPSTGEASVSGLSACRKGTFTTSLRTGNPVSERLPRARRPRGS